MNKALILEQILEKLSKDLNFAEQAAEQAHKASTDEQSIAETQYDTLAIESAYLAEGQSRRIAEIKGAIAQINQLNKTTVNQQPNPHLAQIKSGSLVLVEYQDTQAQAWYFIAPAAGGVTLSLAQTKVSVISIHSPLGKCLLGKSVDDEFTLTIGDNKRQGFIEQLI